MAERARDALVERAIFDAKFWVEGLRFVQLSMDH